MSAFVPSSSIVPNGLSSSSSSPSCSYVKNPSIKHSVCRTSSFIPSYNNINNNTREHQHTSFNNNKRKTITNVLTTERLANKAYQLEEDEDNYSCTTAVYFNADGTLSLGQTDGPEPDRAKATWRFDSRDGELYIEIERFFKGEQSIEFMVKRILRGHLDQSRKNLENLPVFTGAMYPYPTEFEKHSEIGFFAMILAVDDLPSEDYDVSAQN